MHLNLRAALACGALAYAFGQLGCGVITIKNAADGDQTEWSRSLPARYEGDACARALYSIEESKNARTADEVDESAETQVLLAVCARNEYKGRGQLVKSRELRFDSLHESFDDRKPDPIRAALGSYQMAYVSGKMINGSASGYSTAELAMPALALVEAQAISSADLSQALAKLDLPEEAKQAFVTLFEASKQVLVDQLRGLAGPEKELLLDTPKATLEARAQANSKVAEHWATFDALAPKLKAAAGSSGGDPELLKSLEGLREQVVDSAGKNYLTSPLFARLTREIALLHALAKDGLGLATERRLFATQPFTETFAQAVFVDQLALGNAFLQAEEEYKKAKSAGLADDVAKARAGRDYSDFGHKTIWRVDAEIPSYEKLLDGRNDAYPFQEVILSMAPKGDQVLITFTKTPVETYEHFNCYKTNRIERISSDGRIQYESHCQVRKKIVQHENQKPLTFAASEVVGFKAGTKFRGMSQGGRGMVLWLLEGDNIVRERTYAIPPRSAVPKKQAN